MLLRVRPQGASIPREAASVPPPPAGALSGTAEVRTCQRQANYRSIMPQDVWSLYGALSGSDPATLTDTHRGFAAIMDLRQEVNAGGFDTYFRAWGGNSAPAALSAAAEVLGQEWATLLREAMELVGRPYPQEDPDQRAARLDANTTADAKLDALDERFYDLEAATDVDAIMSEFVG